MRDRSAYSALIEDLSIAMDHVRGQFEKNRRMTERLVQGERPDEVDVIAVGYTIHNYYNAAENYFLRIAKFFENHLDQGTWHRDLVNRMSAEISGVRPPLLPRAELSHFHELRAFRHVYRTLYDSELDPDKVGLANRHVGPAHAVMKTAHAAFLEKLESIRDAL